MRKEVAPREVYAEAENEETSWYLCWKWYVVHQESLVEAFVSHLQTVIQMTEKEGESDVE